MEKINIFLMPDVQFEIGLDIVAILSAIAFFGYKFYKYVIVPHYNNQKRIAQAIPMIENIYHQVNPNGQTSLFDAVGRIESRLIFLEQKTNAYLLNAHHAIMDINSNGKITGVNRTFCRMLKCTEDELLGRGWLNFVKESRAVEEHFNHAIANENEVRMTFDMIKTNGDILHVNCMANPIRSSLSKTMIGYLGVIEETIP
jgi:PAS domain S-box-containing protein